MSDRIDCFTSLTDAYIAGFERGKDAMRSEFEARIKDLRAENAKLRAALKPLAQHAPTHEYSQPDTPVVIRVLVKDLRAAATALKETE